MTRRAALLVLAGPPCAGKSSTAQHVIGAGGVPNAVLVEVDEVFSRAFPGSDRNRHDRLHAYDEAHRMAVGHLDAGRLPVLECTYARRDQRASLTTRLTERPDTDVLVVEIAVSPADAVRRFAGREQDTDLDPEAVRERASAFPYGGGGALVLASDDPTPPAALAARIGEWLARSPEPVDQTAWVAAGRAPG